MSIISDLLSNIVSSGKTVISDTVSGSTVPVNIQSEAQAVSSLIKTVTGYAPTITYTNNKAYLTFNKNDIPLIQAKIDKIMNTPTSKTDLDVNLAFEPVIYPIVIKKVLPYAIGAIAIGFILGKIIR